MADIAQFPVAHARTLPVVHAQWYKLYYYSSEKKAEKMMSLPVTSLPVT
jgi:hypothetical protein